MQRLRGRIHVDQGTHYGRRPVKLDYLQKARMKILLAVLLAIIVVPVVLVLLAALIMAAVSDKVDEDNGRDE